MDVTQVHILNEAPAPVAQKVDDSIFCRRYYTCNSVNLDCTYPLDYLTIMGTAIQPLIIVLFRQIELGTYSTIPFKSKLFLKGMYYYEATVTDEGLCRVGWATELATFDLGKLWGEEFHMMIISIAQEVWQVKCTNQPCDWFLFQPYYYLPLNEHLKMATMFCEDSQCTIHTFLKQRIMRFKSCVQCR